MSGESYAGIYIPMTLHNIHKYNLKYKDDVTVFKPNIKGMLIVNGLTNTYYGGFNAEMEFAYGHFLISEELYNLYLEHKEECKFHLFGTDDFE